MDIDKPIAIVLFALSLYGCGPNARSDIDRVSDGHAALVRSASTARTDQTRFDCTPGTSDPCRDIVQRPKCMDSIGVRRMPQCAPAGRFMQVEHDTDVIDDAYEFTWCVNGRVQAPAGWGRMRVLFTLR